MGGDQAARRARETWPRRDSASRTVSPPRQYGTILHPDFTDWGCVLSGLRCGIGLLVAAFDEEPLRLGAGAHGAAGVQPPLSLWPSSQKVACPSQGGGGDGAGRGCDRSLCPRADHLPRAVALLRWSPPSYSGISEGVVVDLHGQPLLAWIGRRPLGDRPRTAARRRAQVGSRSATCWPRSLWMTNRGR